MDAFLKSLSEAKIGELGKWAASNLNTAKLGAVARDAGARYGTNFRAGTSRPVVHAMVGALILGYYMEYSHLAAHERQRKYH